MYRRPSKRIQLIRRIITYVLMVLAVVGLAGVILLFVLGYRLDSQTGLEQGALLQFNTAPTGATVKVDGKQLGNVTPNKASVLAGSHTVSMSKTGYNTWNKTVNTPAGTLTWLDYAILVPTKLTTETFATYPTLTGMIPSPDKKMIIMQQRADQPVFELADLRSVQPKLSTITLPSTVYTPPTDAAAANTFSVDSWDQNGRFVIVKHTFDNKVEWIVLDTQNVDNSKNITVTLAVDLSEVRFAGTNGTVFYGLGTDGIIRKIDDVARTISAPLVSKAERFDMFRTNILTYTGSNDKGQHVVGIYQDGDPQATVLRAESSDNGLGIATTQYYNDNYVALSTGKNVTILKGTYPHSAEDSSSLQPFAQFSFSDTVQSLSFSPLGEYLTVQSGLNYESYDVEHSQAYSAAVKATAPGAALRWLSPAYLYTDADNTLSIREFDGTNIHSISKVAPGFAATLSVNNRFLYSIGQNNKGEFTLQRVTLQLT